MKYNRLFLPFILAVTIIMSCRTTMNSKDRYGLVNMLVDSLVNEARYDSIGLKKMVLNSSISNDIIMNPGFMSYEDGKMTNKCPDNNIQDSIFSKFNIKKFKSNMGLWNIDSIDNSHVITDFTLRRKANRKKLEEFVSNNSNVKKEDIQVFLWKNERLHRVHSISTPIFSNENNIAVIFVSTLDNGIRSWTFKNNHKNNWELFCVEQITVE